MFHCFSFATGMREARGWGRIGWRGPRGKRRRREDKRHAPSETYGRFPRTRRGSWGTQDGTAGRRSCLNAVFRALYVAEENYEVRKRKTHAGLGGNAIFEFSTREAGMIYLNVKEL